MGKMNAYRILVEKPEGRDHWEEQDVGGLTILKRILERKDVGSSRVAAQLTASQEGLSSMSE
jgi:hypothetical protein